MTGCRGRGPAWEQIRAADPLLGALLNDHPFRVMPHVNNEASIAACASRCWRSSSEMPWRPGPGREPGKATDLLDDRYGLSEALGGYATKSWNRALRAAAVEAALWPANAMSGDGARHRTRHHGP